MVALAKLVLNEAFVEFPEDVSRPPHFCPSTTHHLCTDTYITTMSYPQTATNDPDASVEEFAVWAQAAGYA